MESKLVAIVEGLHYEVHRCQGYGAYDFSVVVGPGPVELSSIPQGQGDGVPSYFLKAVSKQMDGLATFKEFLNEILFQTQQYNG
jgi:hypothetical protein